MDKDQIKKAMDVVKGAFLENLRKDRQNRHSTGLEHQEIPAADLALVNAVADLATNFLQNLNDYAYYLENIENNQRNQMR